MTENDNIEKLFRDSFGDFEVQPPAGIKKQIDRKLRRPQRLAFWLLGAMLLLVAGVFGCYAWFFHSPASAPLSAGLKSLHAQSVTQSDDLPASSYMPDQNNSAQSDGTFAENAVADSAFPVADKIADEIGSRRKYAKSRPLAVSPEKTGTPLAAGQKNKHTPFQQTGLKRPSNSSVSTGAKVSPGEPKLGPAKDGSQRKSGKARPRKSPASRNHKKTVNTPTSAGKAAGSAAGSNVRLPSGETAAAQTSASSTLTAQPGNTLAATANEPGKSNSGAAASVIGSNGSTAENDGITVQASDSAASANTQASPEKALPGTSSSITQNSAIAANEHDKEKPGDQTGIKPDRNTGNPSKKWLAHVQPGIGFSSASKAAQSVKGAAGFSITAGLYRQLSSRIPVRAGLDFSYASGSFSWSKDSTNYITVAHDSLVLVQDSIPYYDTIHYTTTEPHTQSVAYSSSFTQFAFGISTQIDAPLTEKMGFVVTPGFRFVQTKFLRQSDGATFKSGHGQLSLGLDFYYDRKSWRFTVGAGYAHTWLKAADNPFGTKGVSQIMPRIGIGFRF